MRTAKQRIDKYLARMQSSQIDPTLQVMVEQQGVNFTSYEMEFYPKQLLLRGLLNGEGLSANKYFLYEAYNGELYHIRRGMSGDSLVTEKETLVGKYVALGGDEPLLQSIALSVWDIPEPLSA